jgi:hypothetical protein
MGYITSATHCRSCGLDHGSPPWGEDERTPSFEICDCCGVEAGYEDVTPAAARSYREHWLAAGAKWFMPKARPDGWNLDNQLSQVPAAFRDETGNHT